MLYHYTTADGLKGIVENDELWATSQPTISTIRPRSCMDIS